MAKAGGGGGRGGGGGKFSGKPGSPKAFAATVGGTRLNTRQFTRLIPPAQRKLIQRQRGRRSSSGEYRRIERDLNRLADARSFDLLQRPTGTRLEIYARAAEVINRRGL